MTADQPRPDRRLVRDRVRRLDSGAFADFVAAVQSARGWTVEREDGLVVARDGDRVIADAGDVSESRFARRVREGVTDVGAADGTPLAVEVHAEHGADGTYPLVAAASVVAKVERDARIEALADEFSEFGPVGSGYPSDPTTREFLRSYVGATGELPDCARASWSTSADVLAAAEQSGLSDF